MPEATPVPVHIAGVSDTLWLYGDKAEEFVSLALWAGMLMAGLLVLLNVAILLVVAFRKV